ncbi:MAG: hypothetical protein OEZ68_18330 [Gammaproteobacteria bacterium]|nr:hypothetical protein [Gammaproteobacteria bacterium]MDH5802764.1 hypothetical protein [Gammaproteobacteria bacterium]
MPLLVLSVLIQVAMVVHILKTGRNTMWIWIVVMLPAAGVIAYLIIEVLPQLLQGRAARTVQRNLQSVVNPNKDIKKAVRNLSAADTVENNIKLAEECMKKGMYGEARNLYTNSLRGLYVYDPDIMHSLACAEFELGNASETKRLLDELIKQNPDYKNHNAHLLYARVLDSLGELESAEHEYEALSGYFPGPEASVRYAIFLKKKGEREKAQVVLKQVLDAADSLGKAYNSLHKKWISIAKDEFHS